MKDNRLYLKLECEYVGQHPSNCSGEVKFRYAMTAYHYEGKRNDFDDPNRQFMACESHYEEYQDYWRSMWIEVPRG